MAAYRKDESTYTTASVSSLHPMLCRGVSQATSHSEIREGTPPIFQIECGAEKEREGKKVRMQLFEEYLFYEELARPWPVRLLACSPHVASLFSHCWPDTLCSEMVPRHTLANVEMTQAVAPPHSVYRWSYWLGPLLLLLAICFFTVLSASTWTLAFLCLGGAVVLLLSPFIHSHFRLHLELPRHEFPGVVGELERKIELNLGIALRGPRVISVAVGADLEKDGHLDEDALFEYVYGPRIPSVASGAAPGHDAAVVAEAGGSRPKLIVEDCYLMEHVHKGKFGEDKMVIRFYPEIVIIEERSKFLCFPHTYRRRAILRYHLSGVRQCRALRPRWVARSTVALLVLAVILCCEGRKWIAFGFFFLILFLVLIAWPCLKRKYAIEFEVTVDFETGQKKKVVVAYEALERLDSEESFLTEYVYGINVATARHVDGHAERAIVTNGGNVSLNLTDVLKNAGFEEEEEEAVSEEASLGDHGSIEGLASLIAMNNNASNQPPEMGAMKSEESVDIVHDERRAPVESGDDMSMKPMRTVSMQSVESTSEANAAPAYVFTQEGVDAWREESPEVFDDEAGSPQAGDLLTDKLKGLLEEGGADVNTLLELGFIVEVQRQKKRSPIKKKKSSSKLGKAQEYVSPPLKQQPESEREQDGLVAVEHATSEASLAHANSESSLADRIMRSASQKQTEDQPPLTPRQPEVQDIDQQPVQPPPQTWPETITQAPAPATQEYPDLVDDVALRLDKPDAGAFLSPLNTPGRPPDKPAEVQGSPAFGGDALRRWEERVDDEEDITEDDPDEARGSTGSIAYIFTAEGVNAWREDSLEQYIASGEPKAGDRMSAEMMAAIAEGPTSLEDLVSIGFVKVGPSTSEISTSKKRGKKKMRTAKRTVQQKSDKIENANGESAAEVKKNAVVPNTFVAEGKSPLVLGREDTSREVSPDTWPPDDKAAALPAITKVAEAMQGSEVDHNAVDPSQEEQPPELIARDELQEAPLLEEQALPVVTVVKAPKPDEEPIAEVIGVLEESNEMPQLQIMTDEGHFPDRQQSAGSENSPLPSPSGTLSPSSPLARYPSAPQIVVCPPREEVEDSPPPTTRSPRAVTPTFNDNVSEVSSQHGSEVWDAESGTAAAVKIDAGEDAGDGTNSKGTERSSAILSRGPRSSKTKRSSKATEENDKEKAEEVLQLIKGKLGDARYPTAADFFRKMDLNSDSSLSKKELSFMMEERLGLHLTHHQTELLVKRLDADHNGEVDIGEFSLALDLVEASPKQKRKIPASPEPSLGRSGSREPKLSIAVDSPVSSCPNSESDREELDLKRNRSLDDGLLTPSTARRAMRASGMIHVDFVEGTSLDHEAKAPMPKEEYPFKPANVGQPIGRSSSDTVAANFKAISGVGKALRKFKDKGKKRRSGSRRSHLEHHDHHQEFVFTELGVTTLKQDASQYEEAGSPQVGQVITPEVKKALEEGGANLNEMLQQGFVEVREKPKRRKSRKVCVLDARPSRDVRDYMVTNILSDLSRDYEEVMVAAGRTQYMFSEDGIEAWAEENPEQYEQFGAPEPGDFLTTEMLEALEEGGATLEKLLEGGYIEEGSDSESSASSSEGSGVEGSGVEELPEFPE